MSEKPKRRGRPRQSGLKNPRKPVIDPIRKAQFEVEMARQKLESVPFGGAVKRHIKTDPPNLHLGPERSKHDPLSVPPSERPGTYEPVFHLPGDQYDPLSMQVRTANPEGGSFAPPPVAEPCVCEEHSERGCRKCFAPAPVERAESSEEKVARAQREAAINQRVDQSLRRELDALRARDEEREKEFIQKAPLSAPSSDPDWVEEIAERLERERLGRALELDRLLSARAGQLSLRKLMGLTVRGVAAFLRDEQFQFIKPKQPITDAEVKFYKDHANNTLTPEAMAKHGEWPDERIVELEDRIMRHAAHVGLIQLPQNRAIGGSVTDDTARSAQDQEIRDSWYGPKEPIY